MFYSYRTLYIIVCFVSLCGLTLVLCAVDAMGAGLPLSPEQKMVQSPQVRNNMMNQTFTPKKLEMQESTDWRIRIREAAVTNGDMVMLGEIAEPLGPVPQNLWQQLSTKALWPAPPEVGKPLQINRTRLSQALHETLKDYAPRCILPASLAIQRGGLVLQENDLRNYLVRYLTPQMQAMPGTADLTDFRLPPYIFLAHGQQQVSLDVGKFVPGRISFRFIVQEADGTVLRRAAGTAFLNLWVEVPSAARTLNKGDALNTQDITFIRVNASHLRGMPWDGRGGPWQMARNVGTGQPIFQADLLGLSMIRKGSIVRLIYEKGNVVMEVQAESLADGEPGATIPVRNLQSKKQVYATIRDNKTVVAQ